LDGTLLGQGAAAGDGAAVATGETCLFSGSAVGGKQMGVVQPDSQSIPVEIQTALEGKLFIVMFTID